MSNNVSLEDFTLPKLLQSASIPIFVIDPALNVHEQNEAFWSFFGLIKGSDNANDFLRKVNDQHRKTILNVLQDVLMGSTDALDVEFSVTLTQTDAILVAHRTGLCIILDVSSYKSKWTRGVDDLNRRLQWAERERQRQAAFVSVLSYAIREPIPVTDPTLTLSIVDKLRQVTQQLLELQQQQKVGDQQNASNTNIAMLDAKSMGLLDLNSITLQETVTPLKSTIDSALTTTGTLFKVGKRIQEDIHVRSDAFRITYAIVYFLRLIQSLAQTQQHPPSFSDTYNQVKSTYHAQVTYQEKVSLSDNNLNFLRVPIRQVTHETLNLKNDTEVLLYMVRGYAEVLGGSLSYSRRDENVAVLDLELSLKYTTEKETASGLPIPPSTHTQRKLRVLLSDDSILPQKVLANQIRVIGHDVLTAFDGGEAIEVFKRQLQLKEPIDIIFMDMDMKPVNGVDATRQIRALEKEMNISKPVPIIAVTAYKLLDYQNQSLEAGANEFVTKPLKADKMKIIIEKYSNASS